MSKKLRQEILREFEFLLNEQVNNVDLRNIRQSEEQLEKNPSIFYSEKSKFGKAYANLFSRVLKFDPYACDHFPNVCTMYKEITSQDVPRGEDIVNQDSTKVSEPVEQSATATNTEETSIGKTYRRSFGCKDVESVRLWQGYLGVIKDGKIGFNTLAAAMKKEPELHKFGIKVYMEVDENGNPTESALRLQQSLCNFLSNPAKKQQHEKNQARVKKPSQKKKIKPSTPTSYGADPTPAGPGGSGASGAGSPALEESRNFYDNKKLNEAKQLFDKLLKRI